MGLASTRSFRLPVLIAQRLRGYWIGVIQSPPVWEVNVERQPELFRLSIPIVNVGMYFNRAGSPGGGPLNKCRAR